MFLPTTDSGPATFSATLSVTSVTPVFSSVPPVASLTAPTVPLTVSVTACEGLVPALTGPLVEPLEVPVLPFPEPDEPEEPVAVPFDPEVPLELELPELLEELEEVVVDGPLSVEEGLCEGEVLVECEPELPPEELVSPLAAGELSTAVAGPVAAAVPVFALLAPRLAAWVPVGTAAIAPPLAAPRARPALGATPP